MKRSQILSGLIAILGSCCSVSSQRPLAPSVELAIVGQDAAPIERIAVSGQHVSLKKLKNDVVLIEFWATWCAPCLTEAPVFARWQRSLQHLGFRVIGVAMDDDPVPVRKLSKELHLPYPVLMGDAALARSYGGVLGLPVIILIDRKGLVRKRFDGAADLDVLYREIHALLP